MWINIKFAAKILAIILMLLIIIPNSCGVGPECDKCNGVGTRYYQGETKHTSEQCGPCLGDGNWSILQEIFGA